MDIIININIIIFYNITVFSVFLNQINIALMGKRYIKKYKKYNWSQWMAVYTHTHTHTHAACTHAHTNSTYTK